MSFDFHWTMFIQNIRNFINRNNSIDFIFAFLYFIRIHSVDIITLEKHFYGV